MDERIQIEEYLLPIILDLIGNDANWAKEWVREECFICGELLPDAEHFHLYKMVNDEIWCLDFHYGHAIKAEHVQMFQDDAIDGWVVVPS